MRRLRAVAMIVLGIAVAGGCVPWRSMAEVQPIAQGPLLAPAAPDAVFLQTVLVEQPIGDAFLDRELWETSPSAVSGEIKALLEENGLRAAIISGNPPAAFLEMIRSEITTVNPQFLTFATRKQDVIPTNGPLETCSYKVLHALGEERADVSLRQAGCGWSVSPRLKDGRIQVTCEPQVQHGDRQDWFRPNADGTQLKLQGEMPLIRYPAFGFDVTLGPREFLVIGGFADRPESLGGAFFRVDSKGQARQRVLVVRAGKSGRAPEDDIAMGAKPKGGPSIAVEAARGRGIGTLEKAN